VFRLTQGVLLGKYVVVSGPAWIMTPRGARKEELLMARSAGIGTVPTPVFQLIMTS